MPLLDSELRKILDVLVILVIFTYAPPFRLQVLEKVKSWPKLPRRTVLSGYAAVCTSTGSELFLLTDVDVAVCPQAATGIIIQRGFVPKSRVILWFQSL